MRNMEIDLISDTWEMVRLVIAFKMFTGNIFLFLYHYIISLIWLRI